ncbi:leucine-rich repeat extensin-like protein 5 [Stegodyphus dumicola]|uniref:leucine-rich repeat extensin-like protein 5 n=1 Tax=Stegodyphus dumicola TaxID=202533 RepID=UPI0015AB37A7|nr:leucine-rich repeat extensin-like protein 5 [Stegodyphus dumicola]
MSGSPDTADPSTPCLPVLVRPPRIPSPTTPGLPPMPTSPVLLCPIVSPPPCDSRRPEVLHSPSSKTPSRHIAASVTPLGPPLLRSGHLKQLLARITARPPSTSHSGATSTLPSSHSPEKMPPSMACPPLQSPPSSSPAPSEATSIAGCSRAYLRDDRDPSARSGRFSSFPCYVCGRIFSRRKTLQRHVDRHGPDCVQSHPSPLPRTSTDSCS